MFSNEYPFSDMAADLQVMIAVKRGKRPPRPLHELSRTRGLDDKIWNIIETCWNHDPAMRPTASKVVEYFGNLPDRPSDPRPFDYFDKALPSHVLSYDRVDHPFSTLASDPEEI